MRKTIVAVVAAGLLTATGGVLYSSDAFGASMVCSGPFSGTFTGNVSVPSGAACNLQGATINGNVTVLPGGALIAGGGTTINGNLSATNAGTASGNPFGTGTEAFSVIVCNSSVTGKTAITGSASQVLLGGTSSTGGGCGGNDFGNNVSLQTNHGRVTLSGNGGACAAPGRGTCGIGGNALLQSNTPGPVTVTNNVITGSLSCFSNGAVTSSGNTATTKNGQCPN